MQRRALVPAVAVLAFAAASPSWGAAQDAPARAGDRVLMRIVRDSMFTDTLRIDALGMAVVPLAGDVRLGGVAGNAVQDTLRGRLARFMNPMAVEATLLRRVRVVGDVNRPGVFYVDRTYTIRDALALAQGVAESGDDRRATLDRAGRLHEMANWRTDSTGTWPIESGDQLLVVRLPWHRRNVGAIVTTGATLLASLIIVLTR